MRKPPKHMYECNGGPLAGTKLALCTPVTLPFSIRGEYGRYRPAMTKLKFYDVRGTEIILVGIGDSRVNVDVISRELLFQNAPTKNQIYWEPL